MLSIKRFVLLFFIFTASVYSNYNGLKIIESNLNNLEIEFYPQIFSKSDNLINIDEAELFQNNFEKYYFVKIPITVPSQNGFKLEKVILENNTSRRITDWYKIEYSGIAKNRHIAHITIKCAIFDKTNNRFDLLNKIYLKLSFKNEIKFYKNSIVDNDDLEITINHFETKNWIIPSKIKSSNYKSSETNTLQSQNYTNWIKIPIENEGFYKIDASQISALGYSITKSDISTIKIFGNGGTELSENQEDARINKLNEQEIIIKTNSNGDLDAIIFYASGADGFKFYGGDINHYINHYSTKNYYFLTWGGNIGKRANPKISFNDNPDNKPDSYIHRIYFEEELTNAFINGSGRQWFGRTIFPITFTNLLYNLNKNGVIKYKLGLAHRANFTGKFSIYENNIELGNFELSKTGGYIDSYRKLVEYTLPAEKISSDNRSVLKVNYSNQQISSAIPFFDYYEIHYPRSFFAINNSLNFWSDLNLSGKTEFSVNGFSGELLGVNITDKSNPIFLKNISQTGGLFIFRDSIPSNNPKNYYISGNINKVNIEKSEYIGLRENFYNADLILVTHNDFYKSAEQFKEYRTKKDNISVAIVKVENIYNEFSSGIPDPTAIRDYISYAFHNWDNKPKYVLLWGAGHYDYKNLTSPKKNYLPPYESEDDWTAFDAVTSTCVEEYFVRVAGNDRMPDLAIGRIPIETNEAGLLVLDKIKNYELSSSKDQWKNNILLIADDSYKGDADWGDGATHTNQSEALSKTFIPNSFNQKKIYLVEYPKENIPNGIKKPSVTEELLNVANNQGTLILNWVGHGNPRVWAHETILERETTIPLFKNKDKLFFCVAATCDFGRFDMPEVKCGSAEMILAKNGGAIGVFSSSRVVISDGNAAINRNLYDKIFTRKKSNGQYMRLGDIVYAVKVERHNDNDEKFYLLGDPTLKLNLPEQNATLDTINGISLNNLSDTIFIPALTEVKLTGSIRNPINNSIDDSFNGIAFINVFDADKNLIVIDEYDKTPNNITKFGGALNKSSCLVKNGKFEISFTIPNELSYSNKNGRIIIYANHYSDTRSANGFFNKIKFIGNDSLTSIDAKTPKINIFLESRNFKNGDAVSKSPLLIVDIFDEYGINASGNGIGHLIEAWIDDNPISINLTPKFNSATDGSRNGTVMDVLSELEPGFHKIKVRAWNIYNKYAIGEAEFQIISEKDEIFINNIIAYPNPFKNNVTIKFNHNLTNAFNLDLNIFNINGELIKSINQKKTSSQFTHTIQWDGTDFNGNSVSTGNYIFTINIESFYKLKTTKYYGILQKD